VDLRCLVPRYWPRTAQLLVYEADQELYPKEKTPVVLVKTQQMPGGVSGHLEAHRAGH
jgi:hypothetical protein